MNERRIYAGGILYNPKTRSILLHQRDGSAEHNPHKWAFFGGLSEEGETPPQAFIRETDEELGLKLDVSEVVELDNYPNEERGTHRYLYYVVSEKQKSEMHLTEGADFDWIPLLEVFRYDLTEKTIRDIKTFLTKV